MYYKALVSKNQVGSLSLWDEPRNGRPHALDDEALQAAIEEDNSLTSSELAKQLEVSDETVRLHLHLL
ncbi:hypothetical protein NPIL_208751, partial [Nephila pilipes]